MFDAFGWASNYIEEKYLHLLARIFPIVYFCIALYFSVLNYSHFVFKPLWAVESIFYVLLTFVFIIRVDPVDRAKGVYEFWMPLVGTMLPITLSPMRLVILNNLPVLYGLSIFMTLSIMLTLWGIWVMRRSFSITVEARALVTNGPYRWLRHPIYTGESLAVTGVLILRFSLFSLMIYCIYLILTLLRTYYEEQKLTRVFPEYRSWANSKWWFWKVYDYNII
jgi:protein-S-isoprenylcysteine O-methyltransferase Ste14